MVWMVLLVLFKKYYFKISISYFALRVNLD